MIHFTERIALTNNYYKWIEEISKVQGYVIKDCPLSVLTFLYQNGYINEEKIHNDYLKGGTLNDQQRESKTDN